MDNKEQKEANVSVSKELLEAIKDRIDRLEEENKMLVQIADKKRLGAYYSRNSKKLPKKMNLRSFKVKTPTGMVEKTVMGWQTIKDEVYKDPNTNRWVENQIVNIIFDDGTSAEMPLVEWYRNYKYQSCTLVSSKTDEATGYVTVKVKREADGKEYEVGIDFIN